MSRSEAASMAARFRVLEMNPSASGDFLPKLCVEFFLKAARLSVWKL